MCLSGLNLSSAQLIRPRGNGHSPGFEQIMTGTNLLFA